MIVASELDSSTERIVEYLADFEIPINVVFFRYLKDGDGRVHRANWLIDPVESEARGQRAKKRPWNGRRLLRLLRRRRAAARWEDAAATTASSRAAASRGTRGRSTSLNLTIVSSSTSGTDTSA